MTDRIPIRILEPENNRRGDLFGRLMSDLFIALGYSAPRLTIQKPGRELDLVAIHRVETRRAIAECKATKEPVGGADLNKFVGVLDAEHDDDRPVTGYFISLSGFTETAVEQERQRIRTRIVLLDASQVVAQLIEGGILIPKYQATDLAGRMCAGFEHLHLDPQAEILAYERGWIWVIYYIHASVRTHFALIRSDGEVLSKTIADELIILDGDCQGQLHTLRCMNPEESVSDQSRFDEAVSAYRQYIVNECGSIHLDGLPSGDEVGPPQLESLFVPLHLDILPGPNAQKRKKKKKHRPVGKVLSKYSRLALLGPPGSGKSTLLKRLAVAYTAPQRSSQVDDELPARDWLPIFLRCRDIRAIARGSFVDLLDALARREQIRPFANAFRAYIDRELLAGRILLLVDGIDEISDAGDRAAFVCTLRAALLAYPDIAVVISSREAGFRHVAAHLAAVCTRVRLAPFDGEDIARLTIAWFRQVSGETEEVRAEAEKLAAAIVRNDRILRLASNPLLLTTLLLVKRWMGTLPTRRVLLYSKAVEVLLTTWNVEGHEPIPEDEALPQLCFIASAMMDSGVQEVSRPQLAALLHEARKALPAELGYVRETVDQFINRVEDRSSLLMMTGHSIENGRLVENFEFRHLTFQEFLAARALVDGWYSGFQETNTLASVLEPHFEDEAWREVVPLAAALGGKATDLLIKRLAERVTNGFSDRSMLSPETEPLYLALGNCLVDEAPAQPATIRTAINALMRRGALDQAPFARMLAIGRYGRELRQEASDIFLSALDLRGAGHALAAAIYWQTIGKYDSTLVPAAASFQHLINAQESVLRCAGALGISMLCPQLHDYGRKADRVACSDHLRQSGMALVAMVFSNELSEQWAAAWGLVGLAALRLWAPPVEPDLVGRLFTLWINSPNNDVRRMAAWALARQPICKRDDDRRCALIEGSDLDNLFARYDELSRRREQPALLAAAWYMRALSDAELIERARTLLAVVDDRTAEITLRELLRNLGEIL